MGKEDMASGNSSRSQQDSDFFSNTTEAMQSLISVTSRVDERVESLTKLMDERIKHLLETIETHNDEINDLKKAIHQIEIKMQLIGMSSQNQENRWKSIINFSIQILWVVLAAYLLMKLNLQAPAVP